MQYKNSFVLIISNKTFFPHLPARHYISRLFKTQTQLAFKYEQGKYLHVTDVIRQYKQTLISKQFISLVDNHQYHNCKLIKF